VDTNAKRHSRHGFTLTELLVSLAIIAMLSGLAIPAIVKIGGIMSKKSDAAARDLYGMLRAARMSAVSYRNDVAVVYAVNPHPDNFYAVDSLVIDGYGMASRATRGEIAFVKDPPDEVIDNPAYQDLEDALAPFAALLASEAIGEDDIFVLAREPQARFRAMPNGTAVIGHLTAKEEHTLESSGFLDEPPETIDEFLFGFDDARDPNHLYDGMTSRGMRTIFLFRERDEDGFLEPVAANVTLDTGAAPLPNAFPAHVFLPTGELGAPGSSLDPSLKERITIAVGPAPDAPLEDRFTVSPQEGAQPVMASPTRVEVYRSTGRVQIGP